MKETKFLDELKQINCLVEQKTIILRTQHNSVMLQYIINNIHFSDKN